MPGIAKVSDQLRESGGELNQDAARCSQYSTVLSRSQSADVRETILFVADLHRGTGTIQRKHSELPFDRDGRWQVADGLVASLILKLSRNCDDFPIFC